MLCKFFMGEPLLIPDKVCENGHEPDLPDVGPANPIGLQYLRFQ